LNEDFTPLEAHVILWAIEQGLMARETGKRFEWVIAKNRGDELLANFQDYDWADEVLHTQIGRKWIMPDFDSPEQMRALAESVRDRVGEPLARISAQSKQEPWWPDFIEEVRRRRDGVSIV
jgi:hypothetical protein